MIFDLVIESLRLLCYSFIFFAVIWWVAKELDNWSIVDAFWAYFFSILCVHYLIRHPFNWNDSTIILITFVLLWSFRLGTHLAKRIFKDIRHEDGRYIKMRKEWAGRLYSEMFRFYMIQGVALTFLCTPFIFTQILSIALAAILTGVVSTAYTAQVERRQAMYEMEVRAVLSDGVVTEEEQAKLKIMQAKLGMSDDQVQAIAEQIKEEKRLAETGDS